MSRPRLIKHIDDADWDAMKARADALGLTVQDAVTQAIRLWCGTPVPVDVGKVAETLNAVTQTAALSAVSNYSSSSLTSGNASYYVTSMSAPTRTVTPEEFEVAVERVLQKHGGSLRKLAATGDSTRGPRGPHSPTTRKKGR